MPEFLEDKSYYFCFLCIEKECSEFSFSSQCCHEFENGASDMDCTIDEYLLSVLQNATKEEIPACTTACLGGTEVGGTRVYIEEHV